MSPADLDARLAELADQRARGVRVADEPTGKSLLAALGIASPERRIARSPAEAGDAAGQLGFPVAVKAIGADLPHKSDVGGVAGPLSTAADVTAAAERLLGGPLGQDGRLLVERWHGDGVACFLGLTFDSEFGPLVTFGLGGIWVELLRDVSYRLAPVDHDGALEMLTRLRSADVLRGGRGQPKVDLDRLAEAIERLSSIAADPRARDVLADVDVNPLLASATGEVLALDCTAVLRTGGHETAVTTPRRDARPAPNLDALLNPSSIAVIGASENTRKPGNVMVRNILSGDYPGRVYPVNPRAERIAGLPCYRTVADIPEPVDLAIIILGRPQVLDAVRACAAAKVRGVAVITAGFGEGDEWGREAQDQLRAEVAEAGMAAIGPNTLGLVGMSGRVRASFVPFDHWDDGPVALVAQTGVYAGAVIEQIMHRPVQRIGIRWTVDIGNRIGTSELDLLDVAAADDQVRVVGLYLEDLLDARALLTHAAEVSGDKPIVLLKPGRTPEGRRATASHTGALAADDDVLDQLVRQHGIVRAGDSEEFTAFLKAFSYVPPARGPNVGVITYSGALGSVATDQIVAEGLNIAEFGPRTLDTLNAISPDWQTLGNPADVWSVAEVDPAEAARVCFSAVLDDPGVDQVLAVLLAVPNVDFEEFRATFAGLRAAHPDKPLHVVMYGGLRDAWTASFEGLGVPVYETMRLAVRSIAATVGYEATRGKAAESR